jgi:hypothetical protein
MDIESNDSNGSTRYDKKEHACTWSLNMNKIKDKNYNPQLTIDPHFHTKP